MLLELDTYEINPHILKKYACAEKAPDGAGIRVGIVTAFSYENAAYDLELFCNEYGIPSCIPETRRLSKNKKNGCRIWHKETATTLQYIRAFAPRCEQIVYSAGCDSLSELISAAGIAASECDIVCLNFGIKESLYQKGYRDFFKNSKALFVCAGGNNCCINFPACSAYVICVGGIYADFCPFTNTIINEKVWEKSATGSSLYEFRKDFNDGRIYNRTVPDVSFFAYGKTGAAIYFDDKKEQVFGTSLACSCITGICAALACMSDKILHKKVGFFYEIADRFPQTFRKISPEKTDGSFGGAGIPNVCEILKNM